MLDRLTELWIAAMAVVLLVILAAFAALTVTAAIDVANEVLFCETGCVFSDEDEYYR